MTIGRKLLGSYVALALLAFGVWLYMLGITRKIANSLLHNERHFQEVILSATEAANFAKRAEGHILIFLALADSADRGKFHERCKSLEEQIHLLKRTVAIPEAQRILERLHVEADKVMPAGDVLLAAYDREVSTKGRFEFSSHAHEVRSFQNQTSIVRSLAEELTVFETRLDSETQADAIVNASRLQERALWVLLGGLSAGGLVGVFIVRSISHPIVKLTRAITDIAEAESTPIVPSPIDSRDEIGRLTAAFNRLQEMRERSENRFRVLFNSLADAVLVYSINNDGTPGHYIEVNDAACRRMGYTRAEFLERSPLDLNSPETAALMLRNVASLLKRTSVVATAEYVTKAGKRLPIELSARVFEFDGRPTVMAIARDLSERKTLEAQFREAQKMEVVGQLAGGVAHDFNNLLTAMLMSLNLARMSPVEPAVAGTLDDLEALAHRATRLTGQLLLFARKKTMQPAVLELNAALASVLKMLRNLLGEQIKLGFIPAPQPMWVEADAGMLDQAIMNLCVNARDAMPGGGTLTVRTAVEEIGGGTSPGFSGPRPGRFACIYVNDVGCGMSTEVLSHLFEPFFTTKEVGKGTGLGLATVHGIVQQHQGWVSVTSAVGEGTCFKIHLPLTTKQERKPSSSAGADIAGGHETILLVEDEESVRRVTTRVLRNLGYRVVVATNGREALDCWRQHSGCIDLLVTDMVMPGGMNGLELAERIRQVEPEVKVVVMSGYNTEGVSDNESYGREITRVSKPFETAVLAAAIRYSLG